MIYSWIETKYDMDMININRIMCLMCTW